MTPKDKSELLKWIDEQITRYQNDIIEEENNGGKGSEHWSILHQSKGILSMVKDKINSMAIEEKGIDKDIDEFMKDMPLTIDEQIIENLKRERDAWKLLAEQRKKQPIESDAVEIFKMPTDKQLVDIAILFSQDKGVINKLELANMISMAEFILNRLYENKDVTIPSSIEEK